MFSTLAVIGFSLSFISTVEGSTGTLNPSLVNDADASPTTSAFHDEKMRLLKETCFDNPQGWYDIDGPVYDCQWYAGDNYCNTYGNGYKNMNKVANEACCICGGGAVCDACEEPCWGDGTICGGTCNKCCNGYEFWSSKFMTTCGKEPCWRSGTACWAGITCKTCCTGDGRRHCPYRFNFLACTCG